MVSFQQRPFFRLWHKGREEEVCTKPFLLFLSRCRKNARHSFSCSPRKLIVRVGFSFPSIFHQAFIYYVSRPFKPGNKGDSLKSLPKELLPLDCMIIFFVTSPRDIIVFVTSCLNGFFVARLARRILVETVYLRFFCLPELPCSSKWRSCLPSELLSASDMVWSLSSIFFRDHEWSSSLSVRFHFSFVVLEVTSHLAKTDLNLFGHS